MRRAVDRSQSSKPRAAEETRTTHAGPDHRTNNSAQRPLNPESSDRPGTTPSRPTTRRRHPETAIHHDFHLLTRPRRPWNMTCGGPDPSPATAMIAAPRLSEAAVRSRRIGVLRLRPWGSRRAATGPGRRAAARMTARRPARNGSDHGRRGACHRWKPRRRRTRHRSGGPRPARASSSLVAVGPAPLPISGGPTPARASPGAAHRSGLSCSAADPRPSRSPAQPPEPRGVA